MLHIFSSGQIPGLDTFGTYNQVFDVAKTRKSLILQIVHADFEIIPICVCPHKKFHLHPLPPPK